MSGFDNMFTETELAERIDEQRQFIKRLDARLEELNARNVSFAEDCERIGINYKLEGSLRYKRALEEAKPKQQS